MQNTNTAPDPAAVDAMVPEHRRTFIKSYFQYYGVWNESGWGSLLKKTEEKLCQLLATAKYVKVNQAYFVFESEKLAWGKHVRACGLDANEHRWPWTVFPNPSYWKEGISAQYSDWRSARGLPLIEPELSKATTEKPSANKDAAATTPKSAPQRQHLSTKNPHEPRRLPGPSEQSGQVKMESPDI
ncbi:uncharacterized protein FTOL_05261 [Fusarium torulosum]|uniref:Uncharacterized protein n=1 Tax=Fusarium torulosum TaxID=33205 RepID=A0AAE8M7E0_9HYPO|nr:uncharacterized protein FTOL_05261 [Fusarium torulosum]